MSEISKACNIFVGKPKEKRLDRLEIKWKYNIKINNTEIVFEGVNRIKLAVDRVQW